jgi:SpoVK/Ycf46/Vps4 family AAA+-type ATPase
MTNLITGTGKTSLCKALAHKLYIRHALPHFPLGGLLFEINCHSLFSKWFSESGKLVMKLFQHIMDLAGDDDDELPQQQQQSVGNTQMKRPADKAFIILLIDEVESIASARTASSRSNEPGDAIRVVNAVLTSLDVLRRKKNVLVLCTSNMLSSLDEVRYLGSP